MKSATHRAFWGAVAGSLLLFGAMSWPLVRFANDGIPSAAQNIERPAWRESIPGDHLQLLYHFDLLRDMGTGRIPWFHNVYEFNEGEDGSRYRPGANFMPMSGLYAVLAEWLGQAAGWNLTLWASVFFSAFFAGLWLRRFTDDTLAIVLGTGVILLSPFRWISLFGGSPTGIALMWLPPLAWSVDLAVRKANWTSGIWLGGLLLLNFWADLQAFYFAVLALPAFALLSALWPRPAVPLPWRKAYRTLPGILTFMGVIAVFYAWRKGHLADSTMGTGRDWTEVLLFSPLPRGFLRGGAGVHDAIFVGIATGAGLVFAWVRLALGAIRPPPADRRRLALLAIWLVALLAGMCLAVGVHGPWNGAVMKWARRIVPLFTMIRQPAKIFAVLPLWIGWLLAVGFSVRAGTPPRTARVIRGLALACLVGAAAEVLTSYSPTICLLEPDQPAYARVAQDAQDEGRNPGRILVVPIWPGDAMDTSVPMYFCQRYALRMINGYSPVVGRDYVENVFRRLESANQGELAGEQIDFLLARGIHYLLVHEDLFPEKVSPFPVGETLRKLNANPRIRRLTQSGPVHAFRLLPAGSSIAPEPADRPARIAFPSRRWEAEQQEGRGGRVVADAAASGGAIWQAPGGPAEFSTRTVSVAPADDLAWWVRLRGSGRATVRTEWGTENLSAQAVEVANPAWEWRTFSIPTPPAFGKAKLAFAVEQGDVEVDVILLVAGPWPLEWPAAGMRMPAADFFHAGHVDADGATVVLRRARDPDRELLYGPRLPLPAGDYRWEIEFSTEAPAGEEVGQFGIRNRAGTVEDWTPLRSGSPAILAMRSAANVPVTMALRYNRAYDLKVHAISISARRDPAAGEGTP